MTALLLPKLDLALLCDLGGRRVQVPHLVSAAPARTYAGTVVRFAGDTYGTPFSGEGREQRWQMSARYGGHEQADLFALLDLFEAAADSPDRRILQRTHFGQVAGLDPVQAVVVYDVAPVPGPGLSVDVSWTAIAVDFSLEV